MFPITHVAPGSVSHAQLGAQALCIVFIFFSVQLAWNNFSIADPLCTQSCNIVTGILEIIKLQNLSLSFLEHYSNI